MRPITLSLSLLLWLLFAISTTFGAEDLTEEFDYKAKAQTPEAASSEPAPALATDKVYMTLKLSLERYRLLEIIAISLAVIALLATVLVFLTKGRYSAAHIIGAGEVIFIIFGVILVVILADSEAHLTAPMGILGAVAGYLFGKSQKMEQLGSSQGNEHEKKAG
ncbi:MAG: hypothetical protein ABSH14_05260 [Verrucomicrobiia bacterium]|jgi:drug/metabolite transporter superfamily protein YnfA